MQASDGHERAPDRRRGQGCDSWSRLAQGCDEVGDIAFNNVAQIGEATLPEECEITPDVALI